MPDHTTTDDDTANSFRDDIRPGDIVHDLAQMGWPKLRVVRQEAPSLQDYIDTRGDDLRQYEKNSLAGARLDDEVFLVTFLTESPLKAAKTHYPVPASRIAKQDLTSEADHIADDHDPVFHPADQAVFQFLTDLLTELKAGGGNTATVVNHVVREDLDLDARLVDAADDWSQARADERDAGDQADTDDDHNELGDFDP